MSHSETSPANNLPAAPVPAQDGPLSGLRKVMTSSFNMADPAQAAQAVNHWQDPTADGSEALGSVFSIQHIITGPVETVDDETGELEHWVRTVLVCDDGTSLAFGSSTILDSLSLIATIKGMPPWSPAVKVKLVQSKTRKGRNIYKLLLEA